MIGPRESQRWAMSLRWPVALSLGVLDLRNMFALSTSEAEYVATVHGGRQLLWMGSFLDEIELTKDRPYPLNCDNNSAIGLTQNTKGHGKSKHFAMDYHWIRDSVQWANWMYATSHQKII